MRRPTGSSERPPHRASISRSARKKRTRNPASAAARPSATERCDLPVPGGPTKATLAWVTIHSRLAMQSKVSRLIVEAERGEPCLFEDWDALLPAELGQDPRPHADAHLTKMGLAQQKHLGA